MMLLLATSGIGDPAPRARRPGSRLLGFTGAVSGLVLGYTTLFSRRLAGGWVFQLVRLLAI